MQHNILSIWSSEHFTKAKSEKYANVPEQLET